MNIYTAIYIYIILILTIIINMITCFDNNVIKNNDNIEVYPLASFPTNIIAFHFPCFMSKTVKNKIGVIMFSSSFRDKQHYFIYF
jgi:hypothetical protein